MTHASGARATELDGAALAAEVQRLRVQRYVEQCAEARSLRGITGLVGLSLAFIAIATWEPVASVLGVPWQAIGIAMVPQVTAMVVATWAARRYGIMSAAHRTLECVESAVTTAVGAGLIWTARDASVPLWFIPAVQIAVAPYNLHIKVERALLVGVYVVLLPALFWASGDRPSCWLALFVGLTLLVVQTTRAGALAQSARDLAQTNLLRQRMQQLLVHEERARIARDLHDGLGAELLAVLWQVQELELERGVDPARDRVLEQLRATLDELRRVVADLKQTDADLETFAGALELRARTLCGDRAELLIRTCGDGSVTGRVCGQLDLMVREAIRNALQHARPSRIELDIVSDGARVIEVRDDGIGISEAALRDSTSGLAHLRTRALTLGAELDIRALTCGTRVRIRLPSRQWRSHGVEVARPIAMG